MLNYRLVHLYCVDGTNVVRVFWGYAAEFREQEESDCATLVEAFGVLCRNLAGRIEVELFFDGQDRRLPRTPVQPANLRVRFGREDSSDGLILDRVRAQSWKGGGGVAVVTGDAGLGAQAEAEGGKWLRIRPGQQFDGLLRSIERRFNK